MQAARRIKPIQCLAHIAKVRRSVEYLETVRCVRGSHSVVLPHAYHFSREFNLTMLQYREGVYPPRPSPGCYLMATAPPPSDSSIGSFSVDSEDACSSNPPDPPLPIQECHFWTNGKVEVRIKRRESPYLLDHSCASYIASRGTSRISRMYPPPLVLQPQSDEPKAVDGMSAVPLR